MAYFLQQLINGLTLGAIYGLIAIGYTMVYGIIGMINFAHGEVYHDRRLHLAHRLPAAGRSSGISYRAAGARARAARRRWALPPIYGWTIERLAYRPLRGSFRLAPLISAIGMSILLQNYVQLLQGARVKPLPPVISGGFRSWSKAASSCR